jgi:hypothetical protein
LGRIVEPRAELEVSENEVCKTITANQVKQWPKKGKLQASKLSVKFVVLNRIAAANWVLTTNTCDMATGLSKFIYAVGNKINSDFGTYVFYQTMKDAKTLSIKLHIAFPSILCGIILSQHSEILGKEDVACKRDSPLTISTRLFEVGHAPDIARTSSTATRSTMSRKDMIATMKETCQALEEKKLKLEGHNAGMELEGANEATNEEDEDELNLDGDAGGDTDVVGTEASEELSLIVFDSFPWTEV